MFRLLIQTDSQQLCRNIPHYRWKNAGESSITEQRSWFNPPVMTANSQLGHKSEAVFTEIWILVVLFTFFFIISSFLHLMHQLNVAFISRNLFRNVPWCQTGSNSLVSWGSSPSEVKGRDVYDPDVRYWGAFENTSSNVRRCCHYM